MNTIEQLREHLFETLKALRDPANPMDVARAKTIADVAQVVINSAKVEVEHMKVSPGSGTGFIPEANKIEGDKPLPPGIKGVTRHRIAG
jgi:hypothetical protein